MNTNNSGKGNALNVNSSTKTGNFPNSTEKLNMELGGGEVVWADKTDKEWEEINNEFKWIELGRQKSDGKDSNNSGNNSGKESSGKNSNKDGGVSFSSDVETEEN